MINTALLFAINCAVKTGEEYGTDSKQFAAKIEDLTGYDRKTVFEAAADHPEVQAFFAPETDEPAPAETQKPDPESITIPWADWVKIQERLAYLDSLEK